MNGSFGEMTYVGVSARSKPWSAVHNRSVRRHTSLPPTLTLRSWSTFSRTKNAAAATK
jgi:hypothetical protein